MFKVSVIGYILLILQNFAVADSTSLVELKPGINEISLKIVNKCTVDLKSISVVVDQEDLPEGLIVCEKSQCVDVFAQGENKDELILRLEVKEEAEQGEFEVPLTLQDQAGHTWQYTISVRVNTLKPQTYELLQNYPNPFNSMTTIKYALTGKYEQETQLVIYGVLGQRVRTLVNKEQQAGVHTVVWDGKNDAGQQVASGTYFYRLTSGEFVNMKKMVLLE